MNSEVSNVSSFSEKYDPEKIIVFSGILIFLATFWYGVWNILSPQPSDESNIPSWVNDY